MFGEVLKAGWLTTARGDNKSKESWWVLRPGILSVHSTQAVRSFELFFSLELLLLSLPLRDA